MDQKNLTNTQLVKLCAEEPRNERAWMVFYERFDHYIHLIILRECQQKYLTRNKSQFEEIFQDLAQDVYFKLVQKNCKALREYKASTEESIFTYLAIIARNAVRGYLMKEGAKKRRVKLSSLDAPAPSSLEDGDLLLIDTIASAEPLPDAEIDKAGERQEFEGLLDKIVTGKSKERDILIFKLHHYEGISPEQMAEQCGIALSDKRIRNIISDIKQQIAAALRP